MRCYSVAFQVALAVAFGLGLDPAFAHLVNTNVGEFYAGMLHPLTSAEHLLPAVALALFAGRCGLLPCPSAFVLLLTAVSLQRTGFGLLLVLAFSLGLAGVLTGVGLLFIKGSQLLQNAPGAAAVSRYIPAVSALVMLIIGVGITVEAVWRLASCTS
jgi:ABC-type nickel/cobalt efflux system permease component RcnA